MTGRAQVIELPDFGLWSAISLQIDFEDPLESQAVILLARADGARICDATTRAKETSEQELFRFVFRGRTRHLPGEVNCCGRYSLQRRGGIALGGLGSCDRPLPVEVRRSAVPSDELGWPLATRVARHI